MVLLTIFDLRLAYTEYLLQADMWSSMLDLYLFIIFYQKSPAILRFFNLQTTLLRRRDTASPCTLETD